MDQTGTTKTGKPFGAWEKAFFAWCAFLFISSMLLFVSFAEASEDRRIPGDMRAGDPVKSGSGMMPSEMAAGKHIRHEQFIRSRAEREILIRREGSLLSPEADGVADTSASPGKVMEAIAVTDVLRMPARPDNISFNKLIDELDYDMPEEADTSVFSMPADNTGVTLSRVMVPVGTVLILKNSAAAASGIYNRIHKNISLESKELGEQSLEIKITDMPVHMRRTIEPLMEIEGVSVRVPGLDYAVAKLFEKAPDMQYKVKEEFFTVNRISLEKTEKGALAVKVPHDVVRDLEKRELCLSDEKNPEGKTVAMRLEEGDVRTLARVMAEWARYSPSGFDFDAAAEEKVAKAIIRIAGVGADSAIVRIEESGIYSRELIREIDLIIGADNDARERIIDFMRGRRKAR